MASYTRNNAWNKNGTFDNLDLLWYAKGVGALQALPLDNQNSWWFFAAIHGEYVNERGFPGWGFIPGVPKVPTKPVPSQSIKNLFWDQCQHQSWFFPPWHRGYLIALEAQVRAAVVKLGGPSNWALPYWNYFGPGDEYKIPPAFTEKTLPDGTTNALFVTARYGPLNNGNIFVRIPPVSQTSLNNTIYTGSNAVTPLPGFGGPQTGFHHDGGTSGNLESNPHNQVHGQVGGNAPDRRTYGLMADPGIAALDPIFYLHHCNIDRLWAVWNLTNNNPTDSKWLDGPTATGERKFVMPMPDGSSWYYTPDMVKSLSQVDYNYDTLKAVSVQASKQLAQRLLKLGATSAPAEKAPGGKMDKGDKTELVGTHDGALQITSSGARATVKLNSGVRKKLSASLAEASEVSPPDRVYLQLENVRGTRDAYALNVSVNQQHADTVSLFGLRRASLKDGEHAGVGLTLLVDITNIVDNLHLDNALESNTLDVKIMPDQDIADNAEITVGRVSIYRQGNK